MSVYSAVGVVDEVVNLYTWAVPLSCSAGWLARIRTSGSRVFRSSTSGMSCAPLPAAAIAISRFPRPTEHERDLTHPHTDQLDNASPTSQKFLRAKASAVPHFSRASPSSRRRDASSKPKAECNRALSERACQARRSNTPSARYSITPGVISCEHEADNNCKTRSACFRRWYG